MSDAAQRKIRLQEELDRILPIIASQYEPDRIILFGSLVTGTVGAWSDLDIAIVKQTKKRFLDRLLEVANLVHSKIATDFVVYTPEEFADMLKNNYFVREEIVEKGKTLYDRNQSN